MNYNNELKNKTRHENMEYFCNHYLIDNVCLKNIFSISTLYRVIIMSDIIIFNLMTK
jgi:hypothetical protein